jgi:ribosomal protein S18 acetylase RimI-like enzyme
MTEIRRIADADAEAEQAVELWDRMCRETPDGGPLRPAGRANLKRMLAMLAWHRGSFCLVAVERAPAPRRAPSAPPSAPAERAAPAERPPASEPAGPAGPDADAGRIVGFVTGRVDSGDGLLPGAAGEIESWYVVPEHPDAAALRRRLLEAAIAHLRAGGVEWVIRTELDRDDRAEQAFLEGLGFEADMVTMSLYDTRRTGC